MSDAKNECTAWVVYFVAQQDFLCGTSTNRRYGGFDEARIFRKKSAAINSQKMIRAREPDRRGIVLPIDISVDRKNLFLLSLQGEEKAMT